MEHRVSFLLVRVCKSPLVSESPKLAGTPPPFHAPPPLLHTEVAREHELKDAIVLTSCMLASQKRLADHCGKQDARLDRLLG